MIRLSILICHLPERAEFYQRLRDQLDPQIKPYQFNIEVITDSSPKGKKSIGKKRNELMSLATGEYVAFIDDDDRIGPNYINHAMEGISYGVDCCGLTGVITEDGENPKKFVHSNRYDSWFEKDGVYYRNNNHLNTVRASIAKQMRFPDNSMGEDHDYSKQLLASGLLKTEYWNENEIIYMYDYRSKK